MRCSAASLREIAKRPRRRPRADRFARRLVDERGRLAPVYPSGNVPRRIRRRARCTVSAEPGAGSGDPLHGAVEALGGMAPDSSEPSPRPDAPAWNAAPREASREQTDPTPARRRPRAELNPRDAAPCASRRRAPWERGAGAGARQVVDSPAARRAVDLAASSARARPAGCGGAAQKAFQVRERAVVVNRKPRGSGEGRRVFADRRQMDASRFQPHRRPQRGAVSSKAGATARTDVLVTIP